MKYRLSIALLAMMVVAATSCQPNVVASSESPDRKYSCEISGGRPSLLCSSSKFCYYFNIKSRKSYSLLEGRSFEFVSDVELHERDFHFVWSADQVEVTLDGSTPMVFAAEIKEGEQRWRRMR